METRLYEASMEGSVSALNSLIHDDPLILSKISLTKFSETPLHIAALLGHLDFCKALLSYNFQAPKLVLELDSLKRSPLHLASAAGHAEIVQVLLQENESKSLCLLRDQEERIPLHYAAMRGRVDTIKLLINAQPEYVFEKLDEGETVLHLCVQYNHLEALKLLVESVGYENREFHNMKDLNGGNTILHLAVMLKQIETITYLVSIPGVKAGVDTLNNSGLKAFNMLQHFPKDFRSLKIQTILMDHHIGLREQSNNQGNISLPPPVLVSTVGHHDGVFPKKSTKLAKASHWLLKWIIGYLIQYKGDWLEDARGSIMVVATVIATMTFQTAINPPGGVWQQNINATIEGFDCRSRENYDDIGNICYAGTSVLAYSTEYNYGYFLLYNSTSFLSSLIVIFLVISGIPLKNEICMLLLTIAMCTTLTYLGLTFLKGLALVTPPYYIKTVLHMLPKSFHIWIGLITLIVLVHSLRLVGWIVKKFRPQVCK
ncbi:uncharacterized protein LOC107403414 [Ziziphus jujuba]|uniref:Uncharacterized protein LOC107403414 n=1 Tax=Ziziphus jujuba TaxID=326968 RepID=A0ABM3ZZB5_ZIZJJ|nr:uncharacterized protein LOC107403414 [Ziziphus jujuba]